MQTRELVAKKGAIVGVPDSYFLSFTIGETKCGKQFTHEY
jgi:hypothetical protein